LTVRHSRSGCQEDQLSETANILQINEDRVSQVLRGAHLPRGVSYHRKIYAVIGDNLIFESSPGYYLFLARWSNSKSPSKGTTPSLGSAPPPTATFVTPGLALVGAWEMWGVKIVVIAVELCRLQGNLHMRGGVAMAGRLFGVT
jgi:hypothetical protein